MGLFKPAWMGKNEAKAMRSLDKVTDDDTLFQIATECPHLNVQLRAVSKIQNRLVRLDVARTSRFVNNEVRRAALEGASERELCDVAKCGAHIHTDGIRLEAVRRMSDEALLAEVAAAVNSDSRYDAAVRAAAVGKVNDRGLLLQLMEQYRDIYLGEVKRGPFDGDGDPVIKEAVANAYERMERPPFEWNMIMSGEKAAANLMLDLGGMSYPKDRDELLRVALEKDGDAAARAVSMLPYGQERDTLRELIARGKDEARAAALKAMRLPDDRDVIVACLSDHSAGKPVKLLAARLLPDDDPALDERCCPHCGTVGSVHSRSSWSEYWNDNIHWYECDVCDQDDSGGILHKDEDFSVTLRELRDK